LLEINKALVFSPHDAALHGFLGQTLLALDSPAEARKELESAIELGDHPVDIYVALAITYYKLNEKQKGLELLEKYYKTLNPRTDEALRVSQRISELRDLQ
jgi:tetratricopeptide (TPR) repeat protein